MIKDVLLIACFSILVLNFLVDFNWYDVREMACIDFSFDSRIRKKYVPLINQQRYFRHVKRIAARNLSIPETLLKSELESKKGKIYFDRGRYGSDDGEKETQLYSQLNIVFYYTIHHPSSPECFECKTKSLKKLSEKDKQSCKCGKLLYRSEFIMSTNPSWKGFEGSSLCSPSISQFIIRVYFVQLEKLSVHKNIHFNRSKTNNHLYNEYSKFISTHLMNEDEKNTPKTMTIVNCISSEIGTLFLEWNVDLTGLLYIGEEFPKDRRLTKNSIIFGFAEGFYTSVCSVASEVLLTHSMPPSESLQIFDSSSIRNSYCLNTLIRIQMVQCIIQATATQVHLERSLLEDEFEKFKQKHEIMNEIENIKTSIEFLTMVFQRREQKLKNCKSKIAEIDEKLLEYNMDMSSKIQILKEEFNLLNELHTMKLVRTVKKLEPLLNYIAYHRKLLVRKIFQDIYQIVPFPDGIGYSINNVNLPSAEKIDQYQHKMISIGLGYVAHLVYFVSIVLDVFLFHQIIPYGSCSSILDLYNKVLKNNEKMVPLYPKSKSNLNMIFFKHGWHLLNRIIVFIRQSMGLCTQDFATTLCNIHSLYSERFMSDDCHISQDDTLNRFSIYSPSIDYDRIRDSNSNATITTTRNIPNQKLLCDINEVKINDYVLDFLWKEVEQMTLNSIKNGFSTSSHQSSSSSFDDEIKEIILKQRHQKRIYNSERLSQLTSLLTYSQASLSFNLLTKNTVQSSVISTSSYQNRRLSVTQHSLSSGGTNEFNSHSPLRMNGHCTFQQFNMMRRIRSASSYVYNISPQSLPNHSFLHPTNIPERVCGNPLSVSLDNGLNRVVHKHDHHNLNLHSKSSDIFNSSPNSSHVDLERVPFLQNVRLLNVKHENFNENVDESIQINSRNNSYAE